MNKDAVVLLSGGQDSTTCLFWAKAYFDNVVALSIDYGQRHHIELEAAKKIAHIAKVEHKIFATSIFTDIGDSALVGNGDISAFHKSSKDLPASFVPGRNILFLTIAGALAYKKGITSIVTGTCQTDFSGYYDCRDITIKSLQITLSLGLGKDITIHTPLMWLNKKETVNLAISLPGCMEALAYSHTCYEGQRPPCGKCPACILRAKGFEEAEVIDPLLRLK